MQALLWQRALDPFAGTGPPGRRTPAGETLEESIRRHLAAKVDVRELSHLEQLETRSEPGRNPLAGSSRPPSRPRPGRRRTINGILYVLKTDCAWEDLRREYGSATSCRRWFERWSADGAWEQIWRTLLGKLDVQQKLEWAEAF